MTDDVQIYSYTPTMIAFEVASAHEDVRIVVHGNDVTCRLTARDDVLRVRGEVGYGPGLAWSADLMVPSQYEPPPAMDITVGFCLTRVQQLHQAVNRLRGEPPSAGTAKPKPSSALGDTKSRTVPCKGWRWIVGMVDVAGFRVVRSHRPEHAPAWCVIFDGLGNPLERRWLDMAAPDLADHGIIGAIEHVLLPEAWPEHSIEVRRHPLGHEVFIRDSERDCVWSSGWVPGGALGQTLVHALEAAPVRGNGGPEDGVPAPREWRDSATEGYSSNARGHRPGDETDL
jgi:hypothetical protein